MNTNCPYCRMQERNEALAAELKSLREVAQAMLPVFEAARPLVLNLERLRVFTLAPAPSGADVPKNEDSSHE